MLAFVLMFGLLPVPVSADYAEAYAYVNTYEPEYPEVEYLEEEYLEYEYHEVEYPEEEYHEEVYIQVQPLSGNYVPVFITFEGYNLGHGFYIEPHKLLVPEGTTAAQVTFDFLTDRGHTFSGTPGSGFYLNNISGFNRGFMNPPAFIPIVLLDDTNEGGPLGDFMYSDMSGWIYTVNHVIADVGADGVQLLGNEVIRWQFTVYGLGADLGLPSYMGIPPLYEHADKTELIRVLFAPNIDLAAKQAALDTIINPLATPEAVADALAALSGYTGPITPPDGFWFEVNVTGGSAQAIMTAINNILRDEFGQTAPFDYSVVERLRVSGTLGNSTFNDGRIRGANALGPHLVELDLSGLIGGTAPIVTGMATERYESLRHLIMPAGMNSTSSIGNHPMLETITWAGNVTQVGPNSIPGNFLQNTPQLRALIFLGDTAPTFSNSENNAYLMFRNRNLVAYVPDKITGGYELESFYRHFVEVRNLCATDIPSVNKTYLAAAIAEAQLLDEIDFTAATWATLQTALTMAISAYERLGATQSEVDIALNRLVAALDALLLYGDDITFIRVPAGATVGVFSKVGLRHFTQFTSFVMTLDDELSNAQYDVWRARVPLGVASHIEAYIPGVTVKQARFFTVQQHQTTINVSLTPISDWVPGRGTAWWDANVLTNLDDTGTVSLQTGGVFYLDTFRVWQAMAGHTANYFIEPEFMFEVFGTSATVERVGAPGREQFRITAEDTGVSVIKIIYGPVEYVQTTGASLWFDAIDPRNTLAVVVNVDGGSVYTGITVRNDFDTYYFDAIVGYREFTFTPAAGSAVRVHDPLNISAWGSGWTTYTENSDGSFTVQLRDGRNIIEVTNGDDISHHVVRARGVTVTIENTTNPGQIFEEGDIARISIQGLTEPIEKLAGIYNPGFGAPLAPRIRYSNAAGETVTSNNGPQYQTLTATFTLTYRLTDTEQNVLNGHIYVGSMGSDIRSHRNIPLEGVPPNFNASPVPLSAFGSLPVIVLPVEESVDKTDLVYAIVQAESLTQADYTPASWAVLQTALANAIAIRDNVSVTQTQVDTATTALTAAIATLESYVPTINRDELNAVIAEAEALTQVQFTPVSWAALQTVLANAIAVRDNVDATQIQINAAISNLRIAIDDLVYDITWQAAMSRGLDRIVSVTPAPQFGVARGEWAVLALARAGHDVPPAYFETYLFNIGEFLMSIAVSANPNQASANRVYNPVTGRYEVRLADLQSTENARLIVALTALGIDASSFYHDGVTFDLVARIGNRQNYTSNAMWGQNQGINGPIWNLIALNARSWDAPYEISDRAWVGGTTASNPITIDERINWILGRQLANGGWTIAGSAADPDMTAMVLQALAPHRDIPTVAAAIDRALAELSRIQLPNGGWASWGTDNVQSPAQVIVALTALGIDPQTDSRFVKPGGNAITAVLRFFDHATGSFMHGGSLDIMATEQAVYSLVAYWRFVEGMNALHDMGDAFAPPPVEVNHDALNFVIADAQTRVQANYTPATWADLQTELAPAILVRDNTSATQAEVDAATGRLNAALNALALRANLTSLNTIIAAAEARVQANYTTASWTRLQNALTAARQIHGNEDATQNEVNIATNNLSAAIIALVRVGTGGNDVDPPLPRPRVSLTVWNPNARGDHPALFLQGGTVRQMYIYIDANETAYSILRRSDVGLVVSSRGHQAYAGMYVDAINGLGEFDGGPYSGWMYAVNHVFPPRSSSLVSLSDGDRLYWLYTYELGADLTMFGGGSNFGDYPDSNVGGGGAGGGSASPDVDLEDECEEDEDDNDEAHDPEAVIAEDMLVEGAAGIGLELIVRTVRETAAEGLDLTIRSNVATITLDTATLAGIAYGRNDEEAVRIVAEILDSQALPVSLRQEPVDSDAVIRLVIMVGDTVISNFDGLITVSIPYTPSISAQNHDLLTVYYVDGFGNMREMPGARYENSNIIFTTNHSSLFFVSEWISPFADVLRDSWYLRNVRFAYTNGLMVGIAPGQFSPDTELSRAMMVTLLWRMEGEPTAAGGMDFYDVSLETWYADAIAWASANGIVNGHGDGIFAPSDNITREQMALIFQNYMRFGGANVFAYTFVGDFADADNISYWAMEAMMWANANGLITGRTLTTLVPDGTATRAEAAGILQRFMEMQ